MKTLADQLKCGIRLRTIKPHTVDESDDGTTRTASIGDVAEVASVEMYVGQVVFGILFPESGASGQYDLGEVALYFEPTYVGGES